MHWKQFKMIFFMALLLSFLPIGIHAQTTHQLTMEKAQQLAIEYNKQIKEQDLGIKIAQSQIRQQISTGLPQVTGSVDLQYFPQLATTLLPDFITPAVYGVNEDDFGLTPNNPLPDTEFFETTFGTEHNLNAGITLNQLLFDGSFFVGLEAARSYEAFVVKQKEVTESEIKYIVEQSYYNVLSAEENVNIITEGIELTKSLKNETEAFYKEGFVEKLDVDRLKLLIAQQEADKQNASNQLDLAKQVLQYQIGIPLSDLVEVEEDLDQVIQEPFTYKEEVGFYNNRKEYQLFDQSIGLRELNVRYLKSGYLPKLNAFASHTQSAQRNKFNYFDGDEPWFPTTVLGINLSIPIYDGGTKRHIIDQEKLNIDIIRTQQENLKEGILLEAVQGKSNWSHAVKQYELAKDNMDLASDIYNTTYIKYKEGVGSSLELNNADQDKIKARGQYIQSVVQMLLAKTNLKKAYGYY